MSVTDKTKRTLADYLVPAAFVIVGLAIGFGFFLIPVAVDGPH